MLLYYEWFNTARAGYTEIITSLLCLIDSRAIVYKCRITCTLSCLLFRRCRAQDYKNPTLANPKVFQPVSAFLTSVCRYARKSVFDTFRADSIHTSLQGGQGWKTRAFLLLHARQCFVSWSYHGMRLLLSGLLYMNSTTMYREFNYFSSFSFEIFFQCIMELIENGVEYR